MSRSTFKARVVDEDQDVPSIRVVLECKIGGEIVRYDGETDMEGRVEFEHSGVPVTIFLDSFAYWTTEIKDPKSGVTIHTSPVPLSTAVGGWWHQEVGRGAFNPDAGRHVKIGVIDMGVGAHETLEHVRFYSPDDYEGGIRFSECSRWDPDDHGTPVCGLIGGKPISNDGLHYCGIAPGADLVCVGIGNTDATGDFEYLEVEMREAVEFLAHEIQCDLINISVATKSPEIQCPNLEEGLLSAFEVGCLAICAAGNNGCLQAGERSNVCAPARFSVAVAVSAIGKTNAGPPCCPSPYKSTDHSANDENGFYLASFSSRGSAVWCGAPGVSVVAPIDERGRDISYKFVEGTSFSAPLVCGALATRLSEDAEYLSLPRSRARAVRAKEILRQMCRPIGLDRIFAGHGMPSFRNPPS